VKAFIDDLEELAEDNRDFRQVLYTGPHLQLVVMSLAPGEDIGEEVHPDTDQFFRVESGKGEVSIEGHTTWIEGDVAIVVPAGSRHNIRNTGDRPLRLSTLYAPPQHPAGTIHHTRAEATAAEAR
jgi:mannose-6-phosphate isomerase-like protein (cupin superfamily)